MKTLTSDDLREFRNGTDNYYQHYLMRDVLYTDGTKYVADGGQAHWLLDLIATSQAMEELKPAWFQKWELKLNEKGHGCSITVDDGNGKVLYRKEIALTNFPLKEITFLVCEGSGKRVIMLPGEY